MVVQEELLQDLLEVVVVVVEMVEDQMTNTTPEVGVELVDTVGVVVEGQTRDRLPLTRSTA